MSGDSLLSRQQVAQSAVAPGVNVTVTGVREDGKTVARVEPVRPQAQQNQGTPGAAPTPQMAG